jgi:hypothetical protein
MGAYLYRWRYGLLWGGSPSHNGRTANKKFE